MRFPISFTLAYALVTLCGCSMVSSCAGGTEAHSKYRCKPILQAGTVDHVAPKVATLKPSYEVEDQTHDLRIQLPLRDPKGLEESLRRMYHPQNLQHGNFFTPEEFSARHHPTHKELNTVRTHLALHGFDTCDDGHGAIMRARGRTPYVEEAFGGKLARFENDNGDIIIAPTGNLKSGVHMPILAVHGLSTPPRKYSYAQPNIRNSGPLNAEGIRKAYDVPSHFSAKDQVIGVLALDGYKREDIEAFAKANNIPMPNIKNVMINGYKGQIQSSDGQTETTMDISLIAALAPDAKEIRVFMAANKGTAFIDLLSEIANPKHSEGLVKLVSCSWGSPETMTSPAEMAAQHQLLQQMAAQGQTLISAAGDSGAMDDGKTIGVDTPASDVWSLGVGGTALQVDTQGRWMTEKTWWDSRLGSGGGGGISCVFPVPDYQVPVVSKGNTQSSQAMRNVPDVSLLSSPSEMGYAVIVNGQSMAVGGTSCAAPLWAAFLALADQARMEAKKPAIGFYNPTLYAIGAGPLGMTAFHDIADGSTNGHYKATPAYDDATGFGSFNGQALLKAIVDH